jgi:hypothetical protein
MALYSKQRADPAFLRKRQMAYEIRIDRERKIVEVVVSGAATHEEHMAARAATGKVLCESGYRRLLVDLRELLTEGVISTLACYEFGASYTQGGIPPDCKIAHVLPFDPVALQDVHFTTTVGINRGNLIREFSEVEEARGWLAGKGYVSKSPLAEAS